MVRPTGSSYPRGGSERTPHDNEPRRYGQGRKELCAQPTIEKAQGFVVIQGENHRLGQGADHRRHLGDISQFHAERGSDGTEQAERNRLDAAAIEQAHLPAPSSRFPLKYAHQTCLPDAANAVQEHDERSCGIEQRGKPRQLALPPAETVSVRALETVLDGTHTASQSIEIERVIEDFDFSSRSHPSLMPGEPTRPRLTV